MRKEMVRTGNGLRDTALTFIPHRVATFAPKIVKTVTRDGIRFYKDDKGKLHMADVYDRVFGKRNPGAINLKARDGYSRYQTLR